MADGDNRLPEGTDTVLDDGITDFDRSESPIVDRTGADPQTGESAKEALAGAAADTHATFATLKQSVLDQTGDFRSQAGERARDYAGQGKEKATDALDHVARLVNDAAEQVEEKLGPDYAAYARRAAQAVTGAADGLRAKDIDALIDDAKGYIRASPVIAIGAAAALGFVVARLAKSGLPPAETASGEKDVVFTPDPDLGAAKV